MALLVREADLHRLAALLQSDWMDSVAKEGNTPVITDFTPNAAGDLPCPACGTAAPLGPEGECTDCGLVLG